MKERQSFSEAITNLGVEEVRSQYQRSFLLIVLFSLIFTLAIINFFTMNNEVVEFYGGTPSFLTALIFMTGFMVYQILVLLYLKGRLKHNRKTTPIFKIIHTIVEISFPSLITYNMLSSINMLSFIDSPVTLTYFLFIILSVLHLDFKISIFTGVLAAIQYFGLTYYGFNHISVPDFYASSTPESLHYVRCFLLILSGGAAAFVSFQLKTRMKTAIDSQLAKSEVELLFGQQVSKEVSRALMEQKEATKRREATVMFLDIRNFTSFADSHTAEEVIDYQNKFLAPVIDIINQHQGVVFQILGDGLMACFGSPAENVLHADMAFQASLSILKETQRASDQKSIPPTMIGIGLHSGMMVTGNIGSEQRKQFSISGTPVIVASRIEQLNKKYGSQFLISGEVYKRIATGKIEVTYLGEEPLRGLGKPVEIYKVM